MQRKRFLNTNFSKKLDKSEQKANFKSKIVHERLTNNNIYKSDIKYQMNNNLNFENTIDEETAYKDIRERYRQFTKLLLPLLFCKYFSFSFTNSFDSVFTIINSLIIFLGLFLIWKKEEKEKMEVNWHLGCQSGFPINKCTAIRILLEVLFYFHLIMNFSPTDELSIENMSDYYIPSLIINIILDFPISYSLLLYLVQLCAILSLYDFPETFFIFRLFKNIFTTKPFIVLFPVISAIFLQYSVKKGTREVWALYDSFKKSYFVFKKAVFEEFCYPIFVISKKTNNYSIFYMNSKAEDLFEKIKISKNKNKNKCKYVFHNETINPQSTRLKSNFSRKNITKTSQLSKKESCFEDLFMDKEIEDLFEIELQKLLSSKSKYFDFPLRICEYSEDASRQSSEDGKGHLTCKQGSGKFTFYKGELENYEWYRIVVSPCMWKNQEAFCIQMIKNTDFYAKELTTNYSVNFGKDFNTVIENVDKLCEKVVEAEAAIFKERASMSAGAIYNFMNSGKNRENLQDSPAGRHSENNKAISKEKKWVNPSMTVAMKHKTNQSDSHRIPQPPQFSPVQFPKVPQYEYTLWFFFKYNINFLYDSHLTIKIFNSLMNKRFYSAPSIYTTKLRDLFNYFADYFYLPARVKNFNFKFSLNNRGNTFIDNNNNNKSQYNSHNIPPFSNVTSASSIPSTRPFSNLNYPSFIDSGKEIPEEIIVNHLYLRCILFNVMFFIMNNSNNTNQEKFVDINAKVENSMNDNYQNNLSDDVYIKFHISYKDEKPKINYNTLSQVLSNRTQGFIDCQKDLRKIKIADVGMLTVYYLINLIYDNDIVFQTDISGVHHSVSFIIKAKNVYSSNPYVSSSSDEHKTDKSRSKVNYPFVKISETKSRVYAQYYKKILQSVYKIFPPAEDSKSEYTRVKSGVSERTYKHESSVEDSEYDETVPDDIDVNIESDKNNVKETNFILAKHFENYDKLILDQEEKEKSIEKVLLEKSKLKFLPEKNKIKSLYRAKLTSEEDKNKLKYFYPPRFLIVEDNAFGRINLIDILKKQKFNYLIDIAAYGHESIQKFKFFLNKGYIYDIIFMDYHLLDMFGSQAAKKMREIEQEHPGLHTNIVAVSVEGQKLIMKENLFDAYFEKPIKGEELTEYIINHFQTNRTDIK